MTTILGIESTAHTFGVGIVRDGKVLANQRDMYTTESGGIIPMESAKHHAKVSNKIYLDALEEAGIDDNEIDAIAFSQGPGLAPCLLEGMKFAKELACKLHSPLARSIGKKINRRNFDVNGLKRSVLAKSGAEQGNLPIIPVNHCIAHLEIGKLTGAHHGRTPKHFPKKCLLGAKDPVMLYVSGANTQIIAYSSGKYRIFGETLDVGVGNFIDNFARLMGIGFPGGPKVEKLAEKGKKYIELPYTVKGMDIALSGILTNLRQKIEGMNTASPPAHPSARFDDLSSQNFSPARPNLHSLKARDIDKKLLNKNSVDNSKNNRATLEQGNSQYTMEDLAYSMQETVFAMLVETAERALAHTGKTELLLGGGVACNSRLQEMCKIMCKERGAHHRRIPKKGTRTSYEAPRARNALQGAKFFCPEKSLLVDNAAMIAYLGEIMFNNGIKETNLNKIDIMPRQRTDEVNVNWK